ncbi:hypothetical protein AXE80_03210 [Wenyingzhuangia fucanilytica]|uniref:Right handed beta helix domain-containing protein n=1 Tax=Wenyingzhuangia fucanilytica TaxID=1790137 RepID=A0A1B1Y3K4_9FLAO|nr:right-handed parallel beta-helix repeat-containing protein [Wenyingzhuangia fucanilytica]ANW95356.1 hypothetical protein AXE80_03210 [Wenyingzhuangia fucanilytica]
MNTLKLKNVLFLSLVVLFTSVLTTSCVNRVQPEEFDNDREKDLPQEPSYGDDTIRVASIAQLRKAAIRNNKTIIMVPGEYTAEGTMPQDPKTIYHFSGSNNKFIFKDATIITPTEVLRGMGPGNTHEFATYRIDGSNITIEGGTFKNTGWDHPYKSLSEFEVQGNDISFLGCNIYVQGSKPYGYGDYYGKGSPFYTPLYKHAAMSILGDNVIVDGCDFKVYAFGHGIHIHGSQNTIIRNNTMEGILRPTNEIYEETEATHPGSPAVSFDYKIWFPEEKRGDAIPRDEMLSLTEDGIRAYLDGTDVNGVNRRTGDILVENNFVDKMRSGVAMAIASGKVTVKGNTIINCDTAYSLSSDDEVTADNKGNVAYGPLLSMPYDHKRNSQIVLTLIDPNEGTMGTHNFAEITGSGHNIRFIDETTDPNANLRPIWIGVAHEYSSDESDPDASVDGYNAKDIIINNETKNPIVFGQYSSGTTGTTKGVITSDDGTNNSVTVVTE